MVVGPGINWTCRTCMYVYTCLCEYMYYSRSTWIPLYRYHIYKYQDVRTEYRVNVIIFSLDHPDFVEESWWLRLCYFSLILNKASHITCNLPRFFTSPILTPAKNHAKDDTPIGWDFVFIWFNWLVLMQK